MQAEPAQGAPPAGQRLVGHVAMFTSIATHISGFVMYKDLASIMPAPQIVAAQLAIGALLLWLLAAATGQPLLLRGPVWRIGLLGCLAPVGVLMLMALATARTSASHATIIFGLVPVLLPVLGFLVLRERLRIAVMLGAAIAFVGIFMIVSRGAGLDSGDPHGDALVFAAITFTCATQLTGRWVNRHFSNAVMVTTYQVTVSAVIAAIVMALADPPASLLWPAADATLAKLAYLGMVSIGVNFLAYNIALRRLPVARTGLYVALSPAIGTILAVLFLGEAAGGREVTGILIVMTGVALPGLLPTGFLSRLMRRV